ncbi:MAG: ATP-binding protein [Cyanobacteria bacterium P01_H01_bin.74]
MPSENPQLIHKLFSSEQKILAAIVSTITIFFIAVSSGIYLNYQHTLEDNSAQMTNMAANMVALAGSEHIGGDFPEYEVQSFTDNVVRSNPDIVAVEFYDKNNQLIYKSIRQSTLTTDNSQNITDHVLPLRQRASGKSADGLLGTVHIKFSNKTLKQVKTNSNWIIFSVFFTAWLISVIAVSLNSFLIKKHMQALVQGVSRLSDGDFGHTINEKKLWGDLRLLASAFNAMSGKLQSYQVQNLDTITFERNKLKTILLSIADGVVVCNTQANITLINDAACTILGYKSSDWAINTSLKDYTTVNSVRCFQSIIKAFEKEHPAAEENAKKKETSNSAQLLTHRVEMPEKTLKLMLSPIHDNDDEMSGFVLILHDVTKEAEVDKMKTNFISNVSHELRTPVTTIKSYVDTLYNHGSDLDGQTYNEFVETINLETDRLKKLVNDILDFSRLDEGNVLLDRELLDITPVINLTVKSVGVLAEQKNITLSTTIESNLPKLYINSDSIERVIRNLLSNAIKYTLENGRIKVRAEVIDNGKTLEVSVQDTGIGIADEHLPNIFERFYRVETKVHTVKGTGLGLHLVKVAVEKHHQGQVFVVSKEGEGSTFGFRIPLGEPVLPSGNMGYTFSDEVSVEVPIYTSTLK